MLPAPAIPASHPAAELFPLLEGAELQALADDIKTHGLRNAIVVMPENGRDVILDGRNRLRACEMAGVKPRFTRWTGEGSPATWIVSQNLHRRHLTASQRAMIGAALVPLFEEEAKERERIGGREKGRANLPEAERGRAREKAAEAVNVSPRSVADAVKVTQEAPAVVVEAVKRGDTAVSAAAKALPRAKAKRAPSAKSKKKEKSDWNCAVVLTVPHSAIPAVQRLLSAHGFTGDAVHRRKMRLASFKALKSAI